MIVLALGLLLLSAIPWVGAQGAQLTTVECTSSPRAGGAFRVSFKLTGTVAATASNLVGIYLNGEASAAICLVNRIDACVASAACGCSETGGERTFHYSVSSATASTVNGDWTAVLQATATADTVRSGSCKVAVTSGKAAVFRDGTTWLTIICAAVIVLFT